MLGQRFLGVEGGCGYFNMLLVSADGYGLVCAGSGTSVDVKESCFKKCTYAGMLVKPGATATATRCGFMENGEVGLFVMVAIPK